MFILLDALPASDERTDGGTDGRTTDEIVKTVSHSAYIA